MSDELVNKSVRLPVDLAAEIDRVVGDRDLDFSKFARQAFRNYLKDLRGEAASGFAAAESVAEQAGCAVCADGGVEG